MTLESDGKMYYLLGILLLLCVDKSRYVDSCISCFYFHPMTRGITVRNNNYKCNSPVVKSFFNRCNNYNAFRSATDTRYNNKPIRPQRSLSFGIF